MTVFVDTSALYALLDRRDAAHRRAKEAFPGLLEEQGLVMHNYIVVETVALARSRLGLAVAKRFMVDLVPALELVWVDEGLHGRAVASFVAGKGKPSFVDRVSFEVMRDRGVGTAFTFDADFRAAGFETVR